MLKTLSILFLVFLFVVGIWIINISGKEKPASLLKSGFINLKQVKKYELTIDKIFSGNKQFNNLDPGKIITVIATGDVIPARSVNFQVVQRKNFNWPFEKTVDVLKSADITFINLETPLLVDCPVTQEGMVFCGDYRNVEGLTFAGVDIASLANNHAGNRGKKGLEATANLLAIKGIQTTGNIVTPGAAFKSVKGINFAFLGFNDIEKNGLTTPAEDTRIKEDIQAVRNQADVVVVQFHWGTEYMTAPEERQRYLGKLAIDSGADLVIGNHPHWIKPVELYKPSLPSPGGEGRNKLITYGHGNFVFDQEWSQKTKEGVVGKYTFYGKDLIDAEFLPVEIKDYGQPYFLEGAKKQKILDEMYKESLKLRN